jgi:hypothetical protein
MTSKLAPMNVILSADKCEESLRCIEANSLIRGIPRHFVPRNDMREIVILSADKREESLRCIETSSLILGIPRHFVPRNDRTEVVILPRSSGDDLRGNC